MTRTFKEIYGYDKPMNKKEKAYLVYRSVNGKLTAEVQYGEHTTGEGKQKDTEEIDRYEIKTEMLSLNNLKLIYPCRVKK